MNKNNKDFLLDYNEPMYSTLINQTGVEHYLLPSPSVHNAIWDGYLTSNKELYFSLCSELTTSEYAKLARFDRSNKEVKELFYTKNTYFNSPRYIRDSKIHTAISEMEDGRLIMITHTTDKAPEHPAWLPNAYYGNPWTGYAGSHLIIFDPKDDSIEYLGIPVPRESLYGAVYHKMTKCYYALGFLKGHLYRINPFTMEVKDYGQVVERASYRLVIASDDNIYFSSRNGDLLRFDITLDKVVNLDIQLPNEHETQGKKRGYISYLVNGPDGRLYISTMFTNKLSAYDPETNTLEELGSYMEANEVTNVTPGSNHLSAFDFDKDGILYGSICFIKADSHEDFKVPASLVRWDVLGGKKPEHLGILGSVTKAVVTTCSLVIDRESDDLFVFGTNHGNDAGDILQIDLKEYRNCAHELGPKCEDVFIQKSNGYYDEHNESIVTTLDYWANNSYYCMPDMVLPIAVWRDLKLDPNYTISGLSVSDSISVCFNGNVVSYDFGGNLIESNEKVSFEPFTKDDTGRISFNYPGRQFLQKSVDIIRLDAGGRVLVSEDGLLCYESSDGVMRNYGPVWVQSPLISWTKLNNKDIIYGVAGDPDDFSVVFRFTVETGIEWLGYLGVDSVKTGAFSSPKGGLVSVSSDDNHLVITSGTTLQSIYIYNIGGN